MNWLAASESMVNWSAETVEFVKTIVYSVLGFVLLGVGLWMMEKVTPFSIRKEIEEDQNVALGVIMAGCLIAIAVIVGAVIRS